MADFLDNIVKGLGWLINADGTDSVGTVNQSALKFMAENKDFSAESALKAQAYGWSHAGVPALTGMAARPLSWAVSADPTQFFTKPVVWGLGGKGSEWDTGGLGMVGNAFDKAGRLAAYTDLTALNNHNPFAHTEFNKRAWDMSFAGQGNIKFGEAVLSNDSVVTDPNGLANLRKEIDGTWYGEAVSGSLDFIMYAAIDPTKAVGKGASNLRAANFVADAAQADKLASTLNTTLDAGGQLGKPTVAARTALGHRMSDSAVAGYQWESKGRFDNLTDVNEIINQLDPMIGMGGGHTKQAIPVIAEMYADASRVTRDTNLQRQIKLNIDYALTGSTDAMDWLAKEYPGIAAKGRRMSTAPSEFTLLENVMSDYAAKGNDIGSFNLGDHVRRHYSDLGQQLELQAYGERVQGLEKFRTAVWESGHEGGPVEFGTTNGGVQVAPRNLEKIKTAINDRIGDTYLYRDGAAGRTAQVVTSLTTPGAHGYISLSDPILGNRQLTYTLKQYADKMGDVSPDFIKSASERFLASSPLERESMIRQLNDQVLAHVAYKNDLSVKDVKELLAETSQAYLDGRKYAKDEAVKAAQAGNPYTSLGDLGGTDTILSTEHLMSHLNETVGIFNWREADQVVRDFKAKKAGSEMARNTRDIALGGIAAYHTAWKHAQLGRFGLVFRALFDTDLRATSMIGTSAMIMQTINGALAIKRNGHLPFISGNELDSAVSSMSFMQANEANRTIQDIRAGTSGDLKRMAAMQGNIARAEELATIFKARQRQSGRFHAQTAYYKAQEQAARDLAERLKSDQRAIGSDTPTGLAAAAEDFSTIEPARHSAIKALQDAEGRLLTPEERKFSNATNVREYVHQGVRVRGSLVENDMQLAQLADETRDTSMGLSKLMLNDMNTNSYKARVEANHWQGNIAPDNVQWSKKYAIAMGQMRDSYTVRRLINEGDAISDKSPAAILRSYLDDPSVRNEYRALFGSGTKEDMARWLSDLATSVKSMQGDQAAIRDALKRREVGYTRDANGSAQKAIDDSVLTAHETLKSRLQEGKVLTPEEIDRLVPANHRFAIFGPNIVRREAGLKAAAEAAMDAWYKTLLDLPDVYLARIPAAVGLYDRNMKQLLPGYAEKALARGRDYLTPEEARDLHLRARGRALNDARRDMYDINRRLGAAGVMRYIAPFFAPWADALGSWTRLMYDNPALAGQLFRWSQTPDMFGITTNRDGKQVNPWDDTPLSEKTMHVPLMGLGGVDSFGIGLQSFNAAVQGNTPLSPGMGPVGQVTGTVLVGKVLPDYFPDGWKWMQAHPDNLVSQSLFMRPGDVPKADVKTLVGSQIPAWWRQASDVLLGADGFGNTYTNAFQTRYNDLIRQYREDHGGADPSRQELLAIEADASSGAKAAAGIRAVISFNLGLSGNSVPEGQFYMDQMHQLVAISDQLHARGTTPEQVFALNYPSAANLNWSLSVNEGHLQATVNATTNYMKHAALMKNHPDVMWWIAGPDNLIVSSDPNGQFSQGAYNQQMTMGLRKKFTAEEVVKQTDIAMGQGRLNAFNNAMRLYMAQNGIKSLSDKKAGQLSVLKAQYLSQIRAQFPAWAEYYDGLNSEGQQDRMIDEIRSAIQSGGTTFKNRPDVVTTQRYLLARDSVIAAGQAQGVVGWRTANAVRAQRVALYQYGQQLARQDVVFAQAWDQLFEHEFTHDTRAVEQAQLSQAAR